MTGRESTKSAATVAPEEAAALPEEVDLSLFPTEREAAEYIAHMVLGLRGLARRKDFKFLAYLLGLALEEARQAANFGSQGSSGPGR